MSQPFHEIPLVFLVPCHCRELLPKDFTVYTYDKEGKLQLEYPDVQDHCHYQGFVEGTLDSLVAVSTCSGLRGLVTIGNVTYGIEPMDPSSGSKHILYRLDNVKKEPTGCGVTTAGQEGEHAEGELQPSMTQLLRRKRAVLHQTRYVELFIVVDKEKFEDFGKSETEVREHMVQLANFLDSVSRRDALCCSPAAFWKCPPWGLFWYHFGECIAVEAFPSLNSSALTHLEN